MRVVVTGGSSALAHIIHQQGLKRDIDVILTERRHTDKRWGLFALGDDGSKVLSLKPDVVIHLAWDMKDRSKGSYLTNVDGSRKLIESLRKNGVGVVFLSSFSASEVVKSTYGRDKFKVERITLDASGTVVRAGVIWGSATSGILGLLQRISEIPLLCPHLVPAPLLFHTEIYRLANLLLDCAEENQGHERILAANQQPIELAILLHKIRSHDRCRLHIKVPFKLIELLLTTFSKINYRGQRYADSFRSLSSSLEFDDLTNDGWVWAKGFSDFEPFNSIQH